MTIDKIIITTSLLLSLCDASFAQDSTKVKPRTWLGRFINEFSNIDTSYVEPNHYDWSVMLQNTNTFEWLSIRSGSNALRMSSDPMIKVGPYIGYKTLYMGYSVAVNDFGKRRSTRTEFELSFYCSLIGGDFIYRKTGEDFRWMNSSYLSNPNIPIGEYMGGVKLRTLGANLYYIFNRKRFSLPSLFAQSTVQKRSCGSFMIGASVTQHKFTFDVDNWPQGVTINDGVNDVQHLQYTDYALTFGYAYNWVLRKNLMFGVSVMPAMGYKHMSSSSSIPTDANPTMPSWIGNNLNLDMTARAALVWNTTKYFAGLNFIMHNYNFSHDQLSLHNTFGTIYFYVGLNFKKRKEYK